MADLKIEEVERTPTWAHLAIRGEIDLDTVSTLKDNLNQLIDAGVTRLVLDMGETSYVNSSALAVLVSCAEKLREREGGIALAQVSQRVKVPFEMLGLLVFFKFFDTVDAAKAAYPAEAKG
ncbi:STAS domain-containing protein [Planctomycetota bacterium]|nr:STAS domain-containing protein [Planctomycetota bacterium]